MRDIVVIGVNYNSDDSAVQFVRSVTQSKPTDANVVIVLVDNSEHSDSTELFKRILKENARTLCIKSPQNLGYFGGARLGLDEYHGAGGRSDWVVVSNVDVTFVDGRFFDLLNTMHMNEDVGVIAPSIWSDVRQRDRNPDMVFRPSHLRMQFYRLVYRSTLLQNAYILAGWLKAQVGILLHTGSRFLSRRFGMAGDSREPQSQQRIDKESNFIYAAHGSCLIFSEQYFARGGDLDYSGFLFGEEIFVAETTRSLGMHVVYDPRLRVHHSGHVSTGFFRSQTTARYVYESVALLVDQYFRESE